MTDSDGPLKEVLSQSTYLKGVQKYYREMDIQPGDPNEGSWHQAHYPLPKHLGGQTVVLLLREHHAVQGVLQSEEYQSCCVYAWEKKYLTGYLLERFHYWKRISRQNGGRKSGAAAKLRGDGIHDRTNPVNIEGALRGGKAPASRILKWQWLERRGHPVLLTREDDGHVFYFDSLRDAARILDLNRKTLSRWKDTNKPYKGYIIQTFT